MSQTLNSQSYKAVLAQSKKPGRNKYGNKPKVYNGRKYQSTKEADYHAKLDLCKNLPNPRQRVEDVTCQVKFELWVNGVHITDYILDFLILFGDGHVEHHDVKGNTDPTDAAYKIFKMKKALMKACHNIDVIEV
jgi:hypothetical protein